MPNSQTVKKVLFIQHGATIMGGVERLLLNITDSYREKGIQAIVVLPEEGELVNRLNAIGIETRIVPTVLFPGKNSHGMNQYFAGTIERAEAISKIIKDEHIDIVHTNTVYPFDGALAAAKASIPHIWHVHSNFDKDTAPSLFQSFPLSNHNARALYANLADMLVGVSGRSLQFFEENHRIPLRVIPNGLNVVNFDHQAKVGITNIRALLNLNNDVPIVGFVGRICNDKDPITFVRAALLISEKRPGTYYVMLGSVDDVVLKQQLDKVILEHSEAGSFHLLGEREDIPILLSQFNALLITSVSEGLSCVCLEALAANCPVISTRCGGPESVIVDGKSGFLTDVGDYRSLAQKAVTILEDTNLANALKIEGRKRVEEHFSWEHFIDQFINLYSELLINFDSERKADPALEICFHLMAKNAELALQLDTHTARLEELEGFIDRIQATLIYRFAKHAYKIVGGRASS